MPRKSRISWIVLHWRNPELFELVETEKNTRVER